MPEETETTNKAIRIAPATATAALNMLAPGLSLGLFPASEFNALKRGIEQFATAPIAPDPNQPKMLTVAQAAKRLCVSRWTLARMANDGTLTRHYLRPGNARSLRYYAVEVDALCDPSA
jgi:excisionase family DNA binding protein